MTITPWTPAAPFLSDLSDEAQEGFSLLLRSRGTPGRTHALPHRGSAEHARAPKSRSTTPGGGSISGRPLAHFRRAGTPPQVPALRMPPRAGPQPLIHQAVRPRSPSWVDMARAPRSRGPPLSRSRLLLPRAPLRRVEAPLGARGSLPGLGDDSVLLFPSSLRGLRLHPSPTISSHGLQRRTLRSSLLDRGASEAPRHVRSGVSFSALSLSR